MKILHTADVHLREYGDGRWKALKHLVEVGKKEKIGLLAISGDLFDKDINAEDLRPKIRTEIFSDTGFKVVVIPGNHDSDSFSGGKYFGDDAEILMDLNCPLELEDVRVFGLPFEPIEGEKILKKLQDISGNLTPDKKNVLLYHGELLNAFFSRRDFGDEGEGRYMPVKLSYFSDLNIDYVLAGHFHSRFDRWDLDGGGYFVYPGSPISITKKETGQRTVNLFEVGKPPEEYPINTPYFEQINVEFDPFKDKDPVGNVEKQVKNLPPHAFGILTVRGFVNREFIGMDETELYKEIQKVVKDRCVEKNLEFKDVASIIEDDLFTGFMKKLEQIEMDEEKKKQMVEIAIKALGEAI